MKPLKNMNNSKQLPSSGLTSIKNQLLMFTTLTNQLELTMLMNNLHQPFNITTGESKLKPLFPTFPLQHQLFSKLVKQSQSPMKTGFNQLPNNNINKSKVLKDTVNTKKNLKVNNHGLLTNMMPLKILYPKLFINNNHPNIKPNKDGFQNGILKNLFG